jgi:hypothetical protein
MKDLEKLILATAPPHYGTPDAPNTWEALQKYRDVFPLPVYDGGSETSIFSSKEVNIAARAWHDQTHLVYNLSFSVEDEIQVARIQCNNLMTAGFKRYINLIWCDVVGQVLFYDKYKMYVRDQNAFVCSLLKRGAKYGDIDYIKSII